MEEKIVLNDENGKETSFIILDLISYDDREFVVLLPEDADENTQVYILEVQEDDENPEEEFYIGVEEEDVQAVYDIFVKNLKSED